ncbi:hypothetical protein JFN88_01445 [Paenibacillus sp. MAHUQ-46]|uniref:Uncharacterized protein n=1 Tax=Paenibacillus roseus TaxID=2798579 RepID=A0A934IVA9_9BACL|nr:S-Ena type endospore appendage [Paenibacillus roseus]MBJ6359986.1 hypothetical protein [Paenibacillus roseus]
MIAQAPVQVSAPASPASRQFTCDSLSGKIFQLCDGVPRVYFTSANSSSSSIIRIANDTKGSMKAVIELQRGDAVEGVIEQGQQVSFDVPSISRLSISSSGEGGISKGNYTIRIRREAK